MMSDQNQMPDESSESQNPTVDESDLSLESSPISADEGKPKTRLISHEELIETLKEWWGEGDDEEDDEDVPPDDPEFLEPVDSDLAYRTAFMAGQGYDRADACNALGVPSTQYYHWVKLWKEIEAERGPQDFEDEEDDL